MEWLKGLPPEYQGLATVIFIIIAAILAARNYMKGFKEGPARPIVQEFSVAGQLADMGPVKELIEQTGLLVIQELRAAIALERLIDVNMKTAIALERLAKAYEDQIQERRNDEEVEEEVDRRLEARYAREQRDREDAARRRRTQRASLKPPTDER